MHPLTKESVQLNGYPFHYYNESVVLVRGTDIVLDGWIEDAQFGRCWRCHSIRIYAHVDGRVDDIVHQAHGSQLDRPHILGTIYMTVMAQHETNARVFLEEFLTNAVEHGIFGNITIVESIVDGGEP